ncbi:MAG: hypothetical protein Q9172_002104 [Xanthocarpia lactea]
MIDPNSTPPNPYGFGFSSLSPTVLYRIPPPNVKPSAIAITKEPSLILLTAWMNASPRHVAKYTTGYQRLFPTSRILIIVTSTAHFLYQSDSQRIKDLEPALSIVKDLQPKEKMLLHCFSNGGAAATWQLARTHRERTGRTLPVAKAIFDSAPGTQGYEASLAAFSMGLPNSPLAWYVGSGLLRVLLRVWFAYKYVEGGEHIVNTVRRGLNDTDLLPTEATRLYVYSSVDKLIKWEDVEAHAKDAECKGYRAQTLRYLESSHCGHLMQDEKRYWNAVTALWDSDYLSSPGSVTVAW